MSDSTQKLELLRRYAQEAGIPVDCVDKLAFSIPRAARLIDVTPKMLRKLLADDGVPVLDLGPRCQRILTTDLMDFLWSRRRAFGGTARAPEISPSTRDQLLKALRN